MPVDIFVVIAQDARAFGDRTITIGCFAQQEAGGVFEAEGDTMTGDGEEIGALGIGYLCGAGELTDAELDVALVAGALLALTVRVDVFEDAAVYGGVFKV